MDTNVDLLKDSLGAGLGNYFKKQISKMFYLNIFYPSKDCVPLPYLKTLLSPSVNPPLHPLDDQLEELSPKYKLANSYIADSSAPPKFIL